MGPYVFQLTPAIRITDMQKSVRTFSIDAEGAPREVAQPRFFPKI